MPVDIVCHFSSDIFSDTDNYEERIGMANNKFRHFKMAEQEKIIILS